MRTTALCLLVAAGVGGLAACASPAPLPQPAATTKPDQGAPPATTPTTAPPPKTDPPQTPPGDQGKPPDTSPGPKPTGAPGIGEKCAAADDACAPPATCVTYYGIAGARGPAFKSCEVKCTPKSTGCPDGRKCTTIADGPGSVCR
jgi:hypothetical protein